MKRYRLKIPLFYGYQFTKGEILKLQEKENSYENEDGYTCEKWFVESNPEIFELIEEPQEEPQEEVIEGWVEDKSIGDNWYEFRRYRIEGSKNNIPATLILNPKKKKEYMRWVKDSTIGYIKNNYPMNRVFALTKDDNFCNKITITVEDSNNE